MNILVLNTGSSSLKFQVVDTDQERIATDTDRKLARGNVERIGSQALLRFESGEGHVLRDARPIRDHRSAIDVALRWLVSEESAIPEVRSPLRHPRGRPPRRARRRAIQGIDPDRQRRDRRHPGLHRPGAAPQPGEPEGDLRRARAVRPRHPSGGGLRYRLPLDDARVRLPVRAPLPGLPPLQLRRYGFHGTSHRYVAFRYRKLTGKTRPRRTSSRCTSAMAARPAPSRAASRWIPRWG